MQAEKTIYWYDLESFGSDPRVDRACQFAGVRTDEALNIVDAPLVLYCQPALDVLPDPEACLITGITPQLALQNGLSEADFATRIHAEFSEAHTCVAGYNNLRFDDEIMRRLFYRCFYDPYEREWKNGNSRWDIIDLLRMTHALRPAGINWPLKEDASVSFKLEALTEANGIGHESAHDALSDVYATIAMAKLVREKQPRLYEYYFKLRDKHAVVAMLNLADPEILLHISSRYPSSRGCMAPVIPLIMDPSNPNGFIVYDLSRDPQDWVDEDVESIQSRLFVSNEELPENTERIGLKTLHSNRCPAIAPLSVLTPDILDTYAIDLEQCEAHRQILLGNQGLKEKLKQVFTPRFKAETDPDLMLYSGGFFDQHDRQLMQQCRHMPADELAVFSPSFHDQRLPELLFRYRCRNFPDTLSQDELKQWHAICRDRLMLADERGRNLPGMHAVIIEKLKTATPEQKLVLEELNQYIGWLCSELGIESL